MCSVLACTRINNLQILILVFWQFAIVTDCKTVHGVLSSRQARLYQGQYITKFCFYGKFSFCSLIKLQTEIR